MQVHSSIAAAGVLGLAGIALGHGGVPGDHFKIGFYNGHDGTFEAPADPAWPDTLLVDTHPWELEGVFWFINPSDPNTLLGAGWLGDVPGFDSLAPSEQEFDGHGFFDFEGTSVLPALEIMGLTPGLEILKPDLTSYMVGETITLALAPFHIHPNYFVSQATGAQPGDEFVATLRVVDLSGQMDTSEPFTVVLRLMGDCPIDLAQPLGTVNIFDIFAYFNLFSAANPAANLNGDGIINVFDILEFFSRFAAGC